MGCGCQNKTVRGCSSRCNCSCHTHEQEDCPTICTALNVANSWNIPACDGTAILSVPGLTTLLIGTYIYNPTYGTFKVVGFNSINGEVTILNECLPDNAAPGTPVAADTQFVFAAPPTLTEYTDWVPTLTGVGMTVSAVTVDEASYFTIDKTAWFQLSIRFTTNANGAAMLISLPLTGVAPSVQSGFPANLVCNSVNQPHASWRVYDVDPTKIVVFIPNGTFTAGPGSNVNIQGFFEIA